MIGARRRPRGTAASTCVRNRFPPHLLLFQPDDKVSAVIGIAVTDKITKMRAM